MSAFSLAVVRIVRSVPYGKVVSYGQVAVYAGKPGAAREVGWILRSLDFARDDRVPWWRGINSQGRISIKANLFHDREEQRRLLRLEGVEVGEDFSVEITRYRL